MKKKPQSQTLLDALDLKGLEPSDQEDILLTLNDLVFRGSLVRLIERMDAGEREQFTKLVTEQVPEDQLKAFLRTIPGAEEVVKETVDELRDDILAVTSPNQ